jgi:four helix bundle suffix protein
MIVVIQQTKYLLDKMIAAQEADFKKHGGVHERMHAARTAARGEDWDKAIYSRLDGAASAAELAARAEEMRERISKAVWSIKRRKNW